MAVLEGKSRDFSLFSSPFDLSASLGSGSSASSSGSTSDCGSGSEGDSPSPQRVKLLATTPGHGAKAGSGKACGGDAKAGPRAPPPPGIGIGVASGVGGTQKHAKAFPPRAGPSHFLSQSAISTPTPPVKSHLKPHVNHSYSGAPPSSPYERPHSFPSSNWHGRHAHTPTHHRDLGFRLQGPASGDERYSITITSPVTSPMPREMSMRGDGTLLGEMHRMSMHRSMHDEPRVVDISPASGYYEARKPRLRNGGLNARLYNAFRVTTKDHLSINTRSPSLRGARGNTSFTSDASMSGGDSPYATAARAGSPFPSGWDTPNGGGSSGGGPAPPSFSLGGGDAAAAGVNRSFNTSYGSSMSFASGNVSFNYPNSPGPRVGTPSPAGGVNSAPPTPGVPLPLGAPAAPTPLDGMLGGVPGSPLSPTPPFGIKYKTELCLNWMNTGTCVYGNKCHFGHGDNDLRARKRVRNFKTQMCCDPAREGARRCMFNARCNFLHPSEPLRRAEPVPYFDEDYFGMLMRDFPGNDYPFGIYV